MLEKRITMARIVVMFCITAVTAFAGIAQANDGGWRGEHGCKHQRHDRSEFAQKLGLTDAQKAQAKAIFEGNKDIVKPLFARLRSERKNLRALIHADAIDEAAIRAETSRISGIQADLNVDRAKSAAQFRAILTPSQRSILKTMHHKGHQEDGTTSAPTE